MKKDSSIRLNRGVVCNVFHTFQISQTGDFEKQILDGENSRISKWKRMDNRVNKKLNIKKNNENAFDHYQYITFSQNAGFFYKI